MNIEPIPNSSENNKYELTGISANKLTDSKIPQNNEKADAQPDERELIKEKYFKKWLSEFQEDVNLNEVYEIMHMLPE